MSEEYTSIFPKAYVAAEHEKTIYEKWESSGAFTPHTDLTKPAYTIVMPPPNANGNLHMGHALVIAIEDILIRYHRMRGERTLWIPGSDHAGFETQVVFEKKLEKEGRSRFQMTREQFYDEVMQFTLENKKNMESQVRMLGASCDWTTERFTLDKEVVTQAYETFKKMYDDGLIYRGERIVNYSVKYQTAYSDIEVIHEDRQEPLYYLKYGPFTVATVRPETKFGEKYIVVHPDDKRYQKYIGTSFMAKIATGEEVEMKVIADEAIKPEFGTGAMTITPAHDPVDFEIARRHNLPIIPIIGLDGRLLPIAGPFAGMKVRPAREAIVAKLQEFGLVEKIDTSYVHSVALCYKSNQPIEPMVMPQWYVKVGPLAERAIAAIENGEIKYFPQSYTKIQIEWLRNLKDWNISRQIWWGIPIKDALPEVPEVAQDPDTFDTWFSSGQWPYIVLESLNRLRADGRDYLKEFYPISVMETGRDLIFPWVSRMIMLGLYRYNQVPFKEVYLHGMVLDPWGKKMSKSKGNVVSPVDVVAKYGCDAVRFGLIVGSAAGSDIPLPEEKFVGGRNFANKIWNIARFVDMQLSGVCPFKESEAITLTNLREKARTDADRLILEQLTSTIKDVDAHIANYRFAQAAQTLHEFVWKQFADVYIEAAKSQEDKASTGALLYGILLISLKLLHPFMPFVTETIFGQLPREKGMLITADWPTV